MNAKLKKSLNIAAAAFFVIGLAINIQMSLDDPFGNVSAVALAQETGTSGNDGYEVKRIHSATTITLTYIESNGVVRTSTCDKSSWTECSGEGPISCTPVSASIYNCTDAECSGGTSV